MIRTMKKIILLLICFFHSFGISAQDLTSLLKLKPGDKINKTTKLTGTNKDFSFEIDLKKDLIHSVSIEFNKPIDPSKIIKSNAEGYCMVEKPDGHVIIYQHYFFDKDLNHRYELSPLKQVSKILIQNMPGAIENQKCTFASFKMREVE